MGNILTKQFYRQRKDFEDSCAGRDAGLTFPEGVRCSTDIAYADDGIKAHLLDIYRPEDSQEKVLPVIINVHGGLLVIRSLTDISVLCFARRDFLYTA